MTGVMKKLFYGESLRLLFLVLLSAAVRVYFLFAYDSMPGDAAGHVERAWHILTDPSLKSNFEGSSSVLYKYALASFIFFWRDLFYAPKVFTLIFGIFLILPYYGTLKTLFNKRVAFFASLVLVFYPLHIFQSSVTTSDAVYYFFLFSSFHYFFRFQAGQERVLVLWLAAALFNIAALLRFESWMFIPVLSVLLWQKGKRIVLLFLILALILPLADMALNHIYCDDFLYTFHVAGKTIHASIAAGKVPYDPRFWSWLFLLMKSSGPALVIGGLLGMALAMFLRQRMQLAIFFMLLFLMFSMSSYMARMWHHDRYSIPLALLLIPYAWFLVDRALFVPGKWKKIFFVCFLAFPVMDFWPMLCRPAEAIPLMVSSTPHEIKEISAWLKNNVRPDETLVIDPDPYNLYSGKILIHSGILSTRSLLIVSPLLEQTTFPRRQDFLRYIRRHRTKYLFLNSKGYLPKILGFDPGNKKVNLDEVSFEVVFERNMGDFGKYLIYSMSY